MPEPQKLLLTARETEVTDRLVFGDSNKEIGDKLGISTETVKEHVQNILRKLNLENRTQVAVWRAKNPGLSPTKPVATKERVFMVFGSASTLTENQDRCINEYEFDTLAELNAFLKGVEAADGWSEYHQADTREEALAYIKEVTGNTGGEEWKFTAVNNLGTAEEFNGYDSQAEAAEAIDRLRTKGYTDFSAPERVLDEDDEDAEAETAAVS